MAKFVWTQEQSVGVEEIDDQHKHFFDLANKIIEMAEGEILDDSKLMYNVTYLNNYGIFHLKTEEDIFNKYDYKLRAEHIAQHDKYRAKMRVLIKTMNEKNINISEVANQIAEFAGDWLMGHIMCMDKMYVAFMHENNIE